MRIVVSIASRDQERLNGLLDNLSCCHFPRDYKIMVLGTGGDVRVDRKKWSLFIAFQSLVDVKRSYATVMYEKIKMVRNEMREDDIFINLDDDYFWNPHVMPFVERIMTDNPQVDYLCLLKGPGVCNVEKVELSGVPFFRHGSMMGGSVIARWKNFLPMMDSFFAEYGLDGMWDTDYWGHLERKTGERHHAYTLFNFSLVQHTNLISHFNKPISSHTYAENFDPRMDPFEWIRRAGK